VFEETMAMSPEDTPIRTPRQRVGWDEDTSESLTGDK
jgi:hypothetical protein